MIILASVCVHVQYHKNIFFPTCFLLDTRKKHDKLDQLIFFARRILVSKNGLYRRQSPAPPINNTMAFWLARSQMLPSLPPRNNASFCDSLSLSLSIYLWCVYRIFTSNIWLALWMGDLCFMAYGALFSVAVCFVLARIFYVCAPQKYTRTAVENIALLNLFIVYWIWARARGVESHIWINIQNFFIGIF